MDDVWFGMTFANELKGSFSEEGRIAYSSLIGTVLCALNFNLCLSGNYTALFTLNETLFLFRIVRR